MKKTGGRTVYSPTDLVRFMESPYAVWMERLYLEDPTRALPDPLSEDDLLLMESGRRFEQEYIGKLKSGGVDVHEIGGSDDPAGRTLKAMREGRPLIYQGTLEMDRFEGRADFLVRVSGASRLGDHHYTVRDTKLGRSPKPHYLIQLCVYAEMIERAQEVRPEGFSVVLGTGEERSYRTDDFHYFYLALKEEFLKWMDAFDPAHEPPPDLGGEYDRWQSRAEAYFRGRDHLWLVAGITEQQIKRLEVTGIATVPGLAGTELARVDGIGQEAFVRLKQQARLQLESRGKEKAAFEIIRPSPEHPRSGLALLPPPSELDVFFDMEGYPYLDEPREYLFGTLPAGDGVYQDWWGHDADEEKRAFEQFVDWAHGRWKRDSSMHIYHYASYEVSALRRLMGRHGTREQEVDDLLRAEAFVDLYGVVRGGVRIGAESYKLKEIEALYWPGRKGDVKSAGDSMIIYRRWLDSGDPGQWERSPLLKRIREYNAEDCESIRRLAGWLRDLQHREGIGWAPKPPVAEEAPKPPKPGAITREDRGRLAKRVLAQLPPERERRKDPGRWNLPALLGYLVEYHRREDKPAWWRLFDRNAAAERGEVEALVDDLGCLGNLVRDPAQQPKTIDRSVGWWFRFDPDQDTKIDAGDDKVCIVPDGARFFRTCEVHELDAEAGVACLKVGPTLQTAFPGGHQPERCSLVPFEIVSATAIEDSIYACVSRWLDGGKIHTALEDFLLRRPPRIKGYSGGSLVRKGEDAQAAAVRVVGDLDGSYLYVQGPPGAGKTTTAAEMILRLAKDGAKIGIAANSHKVILNLLDKCLAIARDRGQVVRAGKAGAKDSEEFVRRWGAAVTIAETGPMLKMLGTMQVVGGTAWFFSNKDAEGKFDYLFVDEAGQVSVANLAGMVRAARNIVLVGDQMQLAQPVQGSHPEDSGMSVLNYLLRGEPTIPEDRGIFLDHTWRLHPDLCRFVSGAFYGGHLRSRQGTEANRIAVPSGGGGQVPVGAGLLFAGVDHEGNTQASEEEVEAIKGIVADLDGRDFTARRGERAGKLTINDMLFVAPYNMQVNRLRSALGRAARVGSVDKFQGQEAPVVIVSMCASHGEISTRGIDFLLNRNRLNVAVSRAECLAIVVGSPALARSRCGSVDQMTMTNTFCRLAQEGRRQM